MFFPEYTITPKILKNIANAEYAKAIIETTPVLQNLEKQLMKDTKVRIIANNLLLNKINTQEKAIKRYVDGIEKKTEPYITNINTCLNYISENIRIVEIDEELLKNFHKQLTDQSIYRSTPVAGKPNPEILLANIVEVFDWYQSIDSKAAHPVIAAAILKSQLDILGVFEDFNGTTVNMLIYAALAYTGYSVKNYICLEDYFVKTKLEYNKNLAMAESGELTEWIEYFTEAFASEVINAKEHVLLMEKDTRMAKASGRTKLTSRQQRILEYLQDYGSMRNGDFATIFPDVSEDSVLRDLKTLIVQNLVVKAGSTKSSRYELR